MENKKNCWIIPTDKSQLSCMFYDSKENLVVNSFYDYNCNGINLYITNDENPVLNSYAVHRVFGIGQIVEIKGEECFVSIKIKPTDGSVTTPWKRNIPDIRKIVFTTDIDLIKKGVLSVPNEFLDWFKSKNGKVDFVDVKTEKVINYLFPRSVYDKYIITLPDEKPFSNLKKESFELPFPQLLKEFSNYYIGYDLIEDLEQDTETIEKLHKSQIPLDNKKSKYNCWLLSSYNKSSYDQNLDLYITNDEVITKDDYYVNSLDNQVRGKGNDSNYSYHHKVVLTTNDTLIKNGVQGLSNDILKEINSKIKDNQIELLKEDIECIHLYLDDLNIPRHDNENTEYSIVGRIKKIEAKLNESMKAIETDRKYTKQDIIEFAKWIATPELHGYGKQLYEAKTRHKLDKLEDLIDIWLKQNNKNMEIGKNELHDIHLQLSYGELLIENIEAGSEKEATDIAIEKATNELSYAKTSVLRKRDKI